MMTFTSLAVILVLCEIFPYVLTSRNGVGFFKSNNLYDIDCISMTHIVRGKLS